MARIRRGGSKRENWLEGWIEFAKKRDAREIAEHLNTTAVGAHILKLHVTLASPHQQLLPFFAEPKGKGMYGGELWTMKYLKGFKWNHLKEKIGSSLHLVDSERSQPHSSPPCAAFDKRMRAAKMRTQIAQVRSETDEYKQRVDLAERLTRKGRMEAAANVATGSGKVGGFKRGFNQLTPLNADGVAVAAYGATGAGTSDGFDRGSAHKQGGGRLGKELLQQVFGGEGSTSSTPGKRA